MPKNPHDYTLRFQWDNHEFNEAVGFIRENGERRKFFKAEYDYFDLNGKTYWTMGAPIPETILINRADLKVDGQYSAIADVYDQLFVDDESDQENHRILDKVYFHKFNNILDIGCGTGLFLDYKPLYLKDNGVHYVGVDPSLKMLNQLKKKHDTSKGGHISLFNTKFENYFSLEKFDMIISLFGSISYVFPPHVDRIKSMLSDTGVFILMFYKPDYVPITYRKTGVNFGHYNTSIDQLKKLGDIEEFGNFIILKGTKQ